MRIKMNRIKNKETCLFVASSAGALFIGIESWENFPSRLLNNKREGDSKNIKHKQGTGNKCNIFQHWKQSRNKIKTNLNNLDFML